MPKKGDNRHSE